MSDDIRAEIEAANKELSEIQDPLDKELRLITIANEVFDQNRPRNAWRNLLKRHGLAYGSFDRAEKDWRKNNASAQLTASDSASNWGGVVLPQPMAPMWVAKELLKTYFSTKFCSLRYWRGDFYIWTGSFYTSISFRELEAEVWKITEDAKYERKDSLGNVTALLWWLPNQKSVAGVMKALCAATLIDDEQEEDRCLATSNYVLEITNSGDVMLKPHSSQRFNLFALSFRYDENAMWDKWFKFLEQVFPSDQESIDFIQEWFGYVLSGRTDQQKMASFVGLPRSGKGTISRILQELIGNSFISNPSIKSLSGQFGEQSLIGKQLAVISDARWDSYNVDQAIQVLLAITGEDARTVNRKNREDWHGNLCVRFMAMSNDTPKFNDGSGAMAGRMIHVKFSRSFDGVEDTDLTNKLKTELPGILNWSLQGLKRLLHNGKFTIPTSGLVIDEVVKDDANPYRQWIAERCDIGPSYFSSAEDLLEDFLDWNGIQGSLHQAKKTGVQKITRNNLTRQLRSFLNIRTETNADRTTRESRMRSARVYGLRLKLEDPETTAFEKDVKDFQTQNGEVTPPLYGPGSEKFHNWNL